MPTSRAKYRRRPVEALLARGEVFRIDLVAGEGDTPPVLGDLLLLVGGGNLELATGSDLLLASS